MITPEGLEKIDLENWPHKFTKDGPEVQIREERVEGSQNLKVPVFAIPMICVHCHVKFLQGQDPIPPGPCPARSGRNELKRILNK